MRRALRTPRQTGEAAWGGPIGAGRHGRLYREQESLLFVCGIRCWSLPLDLPADQARRRVDLGVRERSSWHDSIDGRLYRDEDGRPVLVGVGHSGGAELARLLDRPAPDGRLTWVDLLPRWVVVVLVLVTVTLPLQAVWWMGTSTQATITYAYPTTASTFGSQCRAGFADTAGSVDTAGSADTARTETSIPCPDPMPAVGDQIRLRTLGWPARGAVVRDDDLGTLGATVTGLALAACLLCTGLAMLTTRSRRRLTPVLAPTAGLTHVSAAGRHDLAQHLPLRQLAEVVAIREAHGSLPHGRDGRLPRVRDVMQTVRRLRWREHVERLAACAVASEWDAVTVRSARGAVHLVLFRPGDRDGPPRWVVPVTDLVAPATRVTVLGDLRPGALVAVHTGSRWAVPDGPAQPADARVGWALRQELTASLALRVDADPAPTVRA